MRKYINYEQKHLSNIVLPFPRAVQINEFTSVVFHFERIECPASIADQKRGDDDERMEGRKEGMMLLVIFSKKAQG